MLTTCDYLNGWLNVVLVIPGTIGYYAYRYLLLYVTIIKFSIFYPSICPRITTVQTVVILTVCYIILSALVLCSTLTGYAKYFKRSTYFYAYQNHRGWRIFYGFLGDLPNLIIVPILILIIRKVSQLKKLSQTNRSYVDTSMVFQFFIVLAFSYASSICYHALAMDLSKWDLLIVSTIKSTVLTMSVMAHSCVMIVYNTEVRFSL
ncbi:hypothetical protein V3C99_014455 [Haemonchus contortus]